MIAKGDDALLVSISDDSGNNHAEVIRGDVGRNSRSNE